MNMARKPLQLPDVPPILTPIDEYERALGYLARLQAWPAHQRTMGTAPKL
jgi:hypothetical protein